jgi:acetyl-CoA acetyltransferase
MTSHSACIVGVGETDYRRWGEIQDRNEFQLACESIVRAAADCGLPVSRIDGYATFADSPIHVGVLQLALGAPRMRFASSVWSGKGGASCGALAHAKMAVESGQAEYVAVVRSICQGQTRRYGQYSNERAYSDLTGPFGLLSPAQGVALVLQRYAHEYGFEERHLAEVALICRDNAQRNPRAVMHGKPLTLDNYMASRRIADPLRLLDCCLETDGACALIVTTRERARDLQRKPVEILSAVNGSGPGWGAGILGSHNMPAQTYLTGNQKELAADLYAMSGLQPSDVDTVQFYDHFSGMVLISLEDFGFCEVGAAPSYVDEGHLRWPSGDMPMNTAGGSLSEAYVHGLNHVVEGVRQLRGESTSQVMDARISLVTGGAGVAPTSAALLGV